MPEQLDHEDKGDGNFEYVDSGGRDIGPREVIAAYPCRVMVMTLLFTPTNAKAKTSWSSTTTTAMRVIPPPYHTRILLISGVRVKVKVKRNTSLRQDIGYRMVSRLKHIGSAL